MLSARRFFAPGVELSRYWNVIHKSENKVSALRCFGQRGLPQLPSCSQGLRATAQRTPQVVEDAQMWHAAAEIPEAQRSCDCVKEHRSGEWVGAERNTFLAGEILLSVLSLPCQNVSETANCASPGFLQPLARESRTRSAEGSRGNCRKECGVER